MTEPRTAGIRVCRRWILFVGVAWLAGSGATPAEAPWQWAGYYKNLFTVTDVEDNYQALGVIDDSPALDDVQRVRIKVDGEPVPAVRLRVHYETGLGWGDSIRIQNRLDEAPMQPSWMAARAGGRVRYLDLESEIDRGSDWRWVHNLDRLEAGLRVGDLDVSVGRQAVSWGVGLIWSPVDLFAGFAPDALDRDEKLGVDVVRTRWDIADTWTVDGVVEPLDDDGPYRITADESSLAARATTHWGEYDVSALGGQVAGDRVLGGDFSGYLGDAGFRGEWVYTWVREEDERDYSRLLLSGDYGFAVPWNPYVAVEYLYNGLGAGDPDGYVDRLGAASVQRAFSRGNAFQVGRHYLGVLAAVQPTALWTFQSTTVWNVQDGSALEYAAAVRSLRDNLDLVLGLNVGLGGLGTEFGGFSKEQIGVDFANPDFLFAFLKWYF